MSYALTIICAVSVGLLLWAEFEQSLRWKWIAKTAASAAFVLVALTSGASITTTGQLILLGLCLCMAGDILLIPKNDRTFLAGMAAFAAGHLAYIAAFLSMDPQIKGITFVFAGVMAISGGVVLARLWSHLGAMSAPVATYTAIISAMVIASTMTTQLGASIHYGFIVGAVGFAISDIFVARDQFVEDKFFNKAWGLPLYYGSQLILASFV